MPCMSLLFDLDEPAALYIDFERALENLEAFQKQIGSRYTSAALNCSIQFLTQDHNRGKYLVLEPYELYILNSEPTDTQQESLLSSLKDIQVDVIAQDLLGTYLPDDCSRLPSDSGDKKHPITS